MTGSKLDRRPFFSRTPCRDGAVNMPEWMTIWAGVQSFAALATACIAWYQIAALREDQKAWKTLEACDRYESDLVVTSALKSLRDAKKDGSLKRSPRDFRWEAVLVLNYFEGIAIAAAQGFYVEQIVREHLEPIIREFVDEFLDPDMAKLLELNPFDFRRLIRLLQRWEKSPVTAAI
jgi:hypothetical protein